MSAKQSQPSRHVNLRTQQRRLRHLKGISVRNLTSPEPVLWDPLSVAVWFTIHDPQDQSTVYTSGVIQETYNPSWASLLFTHDNTGRFAILNSFVLRVWLKSSGEKTLCFQKDVNLSDYLFMGYSTIRKDGSGFLPNTIIVHMFEGFYVSQEVGGYLSQPPATSFHQLLQVLPPQSLLEVKKSEVYDSYLLKDLAKICHHQHRLDRLRMAITLDVHKLKEMQIKHFEINMKGLVQSKVRARVSRLKEQLEQQRSLYQHEMKTLSTKKQELDLRECCLNENKEVLKENQLRFQAEQQRYFKKRDQFGRTMRKLHLRQRAMIAELAETFCIKQVDDTHTICDVILPNGDPVEGATPEQVGVALGFVAQLVHYLAKFLLIPLEYPVKPFGSRSSITDSVHEEGSVERELPLYVKNVEKGWYQMGLYLLWRDILQLRQHSGYSTNKSNARKTLPILKALLDSLVKDKYGILPLCDQSASSSSTNSMYSVGTVSSRGIPSSSFPMLPATPTGPASPRLPSAPTVSSHPGQNSSRNTGHSNDTHPAKKLTVKSPMDSQSDSRKLSPVFNPHKRWPKSPKLDLARNTHGSFALMETDTESPNYSISVSLPLSATDRVLVNLPVEESLPASLPQTSFLPSDQQSPDLPLSRRGLEFETADEGNVIPGEGSSDESEQRHDYLFREPNNVLEGEASADKTVGMHLAGTGDLALFPHCKQKNSNNVYSNLDPKLSLVGSGEYDPGNNH